MVVFLEVSNLFDLFSLSAKMPLGSRHEIPPGLKNRPGLNGTQRLPSINALVNRLNGATSSSTLANTSNQVTRGGVSKRVFKPNIPVKIDRSKEDGQQSGAQADRTERPENGSTNGPPSNDSRKTFRNKKDFIQIEGTFEGFKSEPKNRSAYSNGFAGGGSAGGHGGLRSSTSGIKDELNRDKRPKMEGDDLRQDRYKPGEIRKFRQAEEGDYLSDEADDVDDLSYDQDEMPISWANYSKMLGQLNDLRKEESNVEEKLENGRLILMPCIFGNVTGDTGYKLQVLKSGKMRLVDKKSGFTVDLLNTGDLEHDAVKEVVELDDDKLLRYGSLTNVDIYSPVRNPNSDYSSILQDG